MLLLILLALALRLLVWRWHARYPLGGDETEYFNQALLLLREHRYVELNLMRPPLYTAVLAGWIVLVDSLVQRLRLIQALVGALTVVPIYALTWRLFGERRVALLAGLLAAASYTLADKATELLTETLFVFGLATFFWLLLKAGASANDQRPTTNDTGFTKPSQAPRTTFYAAVAGLSLGALALLRSVALPLLPLGALWLLLRQPTADDRRPTIAGRQSGDQSFFPRFTFHVSRFTFHLSRSALNGAATFVFCSTLTIAPWTIRNYATYGAPILVDTTGAENLWLDNNPAASAPDDPLGREDAKRQLYALGDDRAARQRLAVVRGTAAIAEHPDWFLSKAWGELQKFFALEYFDDLRERRAIWVPPLEVALRLLLGDGVWLAVLFGGIVGLWLAPGVRGQRSGDTKQIATLDLPSPISHLPSSAPRWLFVLWAVYSLLTALLFHVELRYRLPLYPALLPYAGWALVQIADRRWLTAARPRLRPTMLVPVLLCSLIVGVMLLHRPYLRESWALAWKHARLWQAERALTHDDAAGARAAAQAALDWDAESALARVALARTALLGGDHERALALLDEAIAALQAHPYAHLLRGAILRAEGQGDAARVALAFEQNSLQDLQGWAWRTFAPVARAPGELHVGGGLDLGFVRGFWLPQDAGYRWSGAEAQIRLMVPAGATQVDLQLAGGRPAGAPPAMVVVAAGNRQLGRLQLEAGWHTYSLPLKQPPGPLVLTLSSSTFRPRDYDRASPDDRALGVMVREVAVRGL